MFAIWQTCQFTTFFLWWLLYHCQVHVLLSKFKGTHIYIHKTKTEVCVLVMISNRDGKMSQLGRRRVTTNSKVVTFVYIWLFLFTGNLLYHIEKVFFFSKLWSKHKRGCSYYLIDIWLYLLCSLRDIIKEYVIIKMSFICLCFFAVVIPAWSH